MIITVTFNPSLDSIYTLSQFPIEGDHNRVPNPYRTVGGKGINSARALFSLGADVLALTTIGGDNGQVVKSKLDTEQIPVHYFPINGDTRVSMTLMANGIQTEIVEKGPNVETDIVLNVIEFIKHYSKTEEDLSCVSINGTINHCSNNIYCLLLDKLHEFLSPNTKILFDVSQPLLGEVLNNNNLPYFIKPNLKELSELLNISITKKEEVIDILSKTNLLSDIPFTLISMGADGAVARINNQIYNISIPSIKVINPTGSGDSTVAGVCYALERGFSNIDTLKFAMACGMSNALHEEVGRVQSYEVKELTNKVIVEEIDYK